MESRKQFQRAIAGKLRGDDIRQPDFSHFAPEPQEAEIEHAISVGDPVRLVHLDIPFLDVFFLVLKVELALLLIALPFVIIAALLVS